MPRHSRHHLFPQIGVRGQELIANARVAIIGCGALGSHSTELLGRAGVGGGAQGLLRIIDRDYVDVSNLQRQSLFDTEDADRARPKAVAAAAHLRKIDPGLNVESVVRDFNPINALELVESCDIIVDGTDNFRSRFLINDVAIRRDIPWMYGAAIGSRGLVAGIIPEKTPCFRCLLQELPPFGSAETCDSAGIITPLPSLIASLQVSVTLRWIVSQAMDPGVTTVELWDGTFTRLFASLVRDPECTSCGTLELPFLNDQSQETVTLCGRNSVQITSGIPVDLDALEKKFSSGGIEFFRHRESVTATFNEGRVTVFDDGRVIVEGTTDPLEARSLISRHVGD